MRNCEHRASNAFLHGLASGRKRIAGSAAAKPAERVLPEANMSPIRKRALQLHFLFALNPSWEAGFGRTLPEWEQKDRRKARRRLKAHVELVINLIANENAEGDDDK